MKRDFREEYTNYIESDMPDLWSRIEPNLKEKNVTGPVENIATEEKTATEETITTKENRNSKHAKIYRFIKVAAPAAAGLCILVIGVGVMSISNKSMEATMDATAAEDAAVMEETTAVTEEACAEEVMDEATEEASAEAPMVDEEYHEYAEDYADTGDFAETEKEEATNGFSAEDLKDAVQTESVMENASESAADEMREDEMAEGELEIAGAILLRISKANENEKEAGFAYIYVFQLEDGSKMKVYLTDELCDELEEADSKLQRQKNYCLTLHIVSDTMKQEGDFSADYILQNAEELP